MAIDKSDLFESTKALWPETLDLPATDAANYIYWANERTLPVDDNWRQVALWAFHQGLADLEKDAIANGVSKISPRNLDFSTFDKWMRFNLEGDDEWATERIEWEGAA